MFQNRLTKKSCLKPVSLLLVLSALLPCTISCQTKGYNAGAGKDPYAENIPKTDEEKAYYKDVLSGDWKKDMSDPLGHFGLGKNQVSNTPPAHWTMEPPKGSKTMEQIRAETYEKKTGELNAYAAGSPAAASGSPYKTANQSSSHPDSIIHDSDQVKKSRNNEGTDKSESENKSDEKDSGSSFFKKWTRFQPRSTAVKIAAADESFFPAPLTENAVVRGQAPDTASGADRNITSTANAQKLPIKIDPEAADAWKYVDGKGMLRNSIPKDLPSDEYIVIGGDAGGEAFALPNWDVHNLEADETIAHFDTISGQIKVEPSNSFILYAPRFGTVRQTVGPKSESQNTMLGGMDTDIAITENQREEGIDIRTQDQKTSQTRANLQTSDMRANQPGGVVSGEEGLIEESQRVLTASANGLLQESEITDDVKTALTEGASAAAAWGKTQGVAVQIDRLSAQGNITLQGAAEIFSIKNDTKTSQLRLFKAASKREAAPGELVEFTIRYENVGTETIGNVTILDSLSARLEYVEESAISSKNAEFLVKNNETGSLLLRWEIIDPLEPGDFGTLTFLCRVR